MAEKTLLSETKDGVATLTLNRPDKLNAFNRELSGELVAALASLAKDDGVRAIILTGAGRAFCAGQDLAEAIPKGDASPDLGAIVKAVSMSSRTSNCAAPGAAPPPTGIRCNWVPASTGDCCRVSSMPIIEARRVTTASILVFWTMPAGSGSCSPTRSSARALVLWPGSGAIRATATVCSRR